MRNIYIPIAAAFAFALMSSAGAADVAKSIRSKASQGSCNGAGSGTVRIGTVVGLQANWGGANYTGFGFNSGNNVTDEILTPGADTTDGRAEFELIQVAYLTGAPVYLYCAGGNRVGSVWVDQG